MAKALDDLTWLKGRAQSTATAGVSGALDEVTAFRQDGIVSKAKPDDEVIVQMGPSDRFYIYPSAVAAVMFSE